VIVPASRVSFVLAIVLMLPIGAFARTALAVNPMSFTIAPNEEKYVTAKEIGASRAQPALLGGSCLQPNAYVRVNTSYQDAEKRVLEAHVRRTRKPPLGNGRCNIIFALRGRDGWTDQTTVHVTLTK
jgi:hypothetical protein